MFATVASLLRAALACGAVFYAWRKLSVLLVVCRARAARNLKSLVMGAWAKRPGAV